MNTSKFFVVAAAALSVFSATTFTYAQGTSSDSGQGGQGAMPQTQGQMQQQTTTPNQGSPSRPSTDNSMNRTDGFGTSGTGSRTTPMATDANGIRSQRDGSAFTTERVARADRN